MGHQILEPPVRSLEDFRLPALAFEREASDRYREFGAWFSEHGFAPLGMLCARLAGRHDDDYSRIAGSGEAIAAKAVDGARRSWIRRERADSRGDEFFYRVATARQLIEIALAEETAAIEGFDHAARELPGPTQGLAAALGASSRRCATELAMAMQTAPPPDWESMIAAGGGPCLALGAERRLHRS